MVSTAISRIDGVSTSTAVKSPVHAVATTNITLSGLQTVGGVTLDGSTLYRVLLTGQTDTTQNGIYDASTGSWTRSSDFDGEGDAVVGTLVPGLASSTTLYYRLAGTNPIIPGTSPITFPDVFQLSNASQILSTGVRYEQTPAEQAAGVTPVNYYLQPGQRARYASLADAVAVCGTHPLQLSANESIPAAIILPTSARIFSNNYATITQTTAGVPVFTGNSISHIRLWGFNTVGASASTVPLAGIGGFSTQTTGLITIANSDDVIVTDCGATAFYNPMSFLKCSNLHVVNNRVSNYLYTGILPTGGCTDWWIDGNTIIGCTQAGAAVAYGIQCTGDQAGGSPQKDGHITNNNISGVKSWDAIGSHDIDGIEISGNIIRDCRNGIDIGHLVSTNVVRNINIGVNYIEATTTDTWGGSGAAHAGIAIAGFDATHRVDGVTINGTTCRGFFTASVVGTSYSSNYVIAHTDNANLSNFTVIGAGANATNAGVYVNGTCNNLTINAGSLQGAMTRSGVRLESVISNAVTITGVSCVQTTPTDGHITITGSTITAMSIGNNPTNATPPFSIDSGSTITSIGGSFRVSWTGTLTQCTTSPTGSFICVVTDDLVTIDCPSLTATSANTNQPTITGMPTFLAPATTQHCWGAASSDNSNTIGSSQIRVETTGVLTIFNGTSSTFTAANNKGIINSTFTYRRNA